MKKPINLAWVIFLLLSACSPATVTPLPPAIISLMPGQESTLVVETATAAAPTAAPFSPPENVPDLSGERIVLPALCDKSSMLASENNARIQAMEDVANAINAQGGIFGAQVELRVVDSEGKTEATQSALARTVRQYGEGPLILICDPQTEAAVRKMLNEDEIPALGPSDFAERDGFIFGLDATPQEHLGVFLDEVLAQWSDRRPEGAGDQIRLALISWPVEFSGALTGEQFLADLEELGMQVVFQAELPAELDANIFDLIYQIRDANANVIYTNIRGFGLAALLNGLNDLGLRERFVVGTPASGYSSQLFEYLGDTGHAQGLYITSAWSWWSEENVGIQFLETLGNGAETDDWGYIQMAGAVTLVQQVLEEAIINQGFEDLSPEAVTSALNSLEDYPVMSGLYSVDYSGGGRSLENLRTWVAGAATGVLSLPSD